MDLTNVFRSHLDADRMEPEDVKRLFSPPPGFGNCLQATNQVLIGPRGSGKSIALRWLSYIHQRPEHTTGPSFYGLLIRIGRFQFDHFKQTFARTEDTRPFLAYFNWYILSAILEDLRRPHWQAPFELRLPHSYRLAINRHNQILAQNPYVTKDNVSRLANLVDEIHDLFRKQVEISDIEAGLLANLTSIQDTISLLQSFRDLIFSQYRFSVLGILLDGLDHLGDLGRSLVPLLSKDEPFSDKVTVKAACRELPRYLYADVLSPRLEEGRDYFIIPVGYYDDDEKLEDHLKSVMNNRLHVYYGTHTKDPVTQIYEVLPFGEKEIYSGFSNIAKFSAGNILIFLETCTLALAYEQELLGRSEITHISPESQTRGITLKSSSYFNSDLDDQIGEVADDLRKHLEVFAEVLKEAGEPNATLSFSLEQNPSIGLSLQELLTRACEFRYLSIARASLVPVIRRQRESLPTSFEVTPTLAPRFGLNLATGSPIELHHPDFEQRLAADREFYGKEQQDLFPTGNYIFLSISGDAWGRSVRNRISTASSRIAPFLQSMFDDSKHFEVITFREVSQRKTGRYLDNLIDAIRNSQYIVFDATGGPTSGVVVEMGIASGTRKPYSICWFGDKPLAQSGRTQPFNPKLLPEELQSADIKCFACGDRASREPFYKWFGRNVHQPCMAQNEMCGFKGSGAPCDCKAITPDKNKVYVRIQPRNRALQEILVQQLRRRQISVVLPEEFGESLAAHTCKRLRSVGAAVFDITSSALKDTRSADQGSPRYGGKSEEVLPLLEVGYALGIDLSHACVFREELGTIHSPMLPGDRVSLSDVDLEAEVNRFVNWFVLKKLEGGA